MGKITLEVEAPEGLDEREAERARKAFEAWLSMIWVRKKLTPSELRRLFSSVEEDIWMRHRQ